MDIVNYIATGRPAGEEEQVVLQRPAASMKNDSRLTSQGSRETQWAYSTDSFSNRRIAHCTDRSKNSFVVHHHRRRHRHVYLSKQNQM